MNNIYKLHLHLQSFIFTLFIWSVEESTFVLFSKFQLMYLSSKNESVLKTVWRYQVNCTQFNSWSLKINSRFVLVGRCRFRFCCWCCCCCFFCPLYSLVELPSSDCQQSMFCPVFPQESSRFLVIPHISFPLLNHDLVSLWTKKQTWLTGHAWKRVSGCRYKTELGNHLRKHKKKFNFGKSFRKTNTTSGWKWHVSTVLSGWY